MQAAAYRSLALLGKAICDHVPKWGSNAFGWGEQSAGRAGAILRTVPPAPARKADPTLAAAGVPAASITSYSTAIDCSLSLRWPPPTSMTDRFWSGDLA